MMGRSWRISGRAIRILTGFKASVNGLPMIDTAAGLLNPVRVSADILKLCTRAVNRSPAKAGWCGDYRSRLFR